MSITIQNSTVSYGPNIITDGLVALFDVKNNKCNISGVTEWQILSYSGGVNTGFTVDSGVYDSTTRSFLLNGTDESFVIPKTTDSQTQWGRTISFLCKPEEDSYIFNNADSLSLYFTKNRKVSLVACPYSHILYPYYNILMDNDNVVTLMNNGTNHDGSVITLNLNGEVLKSKAAYSGSLGYVYSYGKIVENDGYQWINVYRGYTKNVSFIDSDSFTNVLSSDYTRTYVGDIDVDDDFGTLYALSS